MINAKYDYSSIHICFPQDLANSIINWGKTNISDDDIYVTHNDPTFGREDDIHTTILYGIHKEYIDLKIQKTIKVKLGKINCFTNSPKYDVVVIDVISEDLKQLNKEMTETIEHTNRYGSYKPHATIAFVKKGKGKKHLNLNLWEGIEFDSNQIIFSSKEGPKYPFIIQ